MSGWTELTGYSFGTVAEQVAVSIPLPISLTGVTQSSLTIISGALPPGLALLNDNIVGAPLEVSSNTEYKFVVRAVLDGVLSDRTFYITVSGSDIPVWVTSLGRLPVGANSSLYVVESAPVNYQLLSTDSDGQLLTFSLVIGSLPAGISLSTSGVLTGTVLPITPLVPTEYVFTVAVTDGVYSVSRQFSILVVAQEFLSADNDVNLINEYPFTTDIIAGNTFVWRTLPVLLSSRYGDFISRTIESVTSPAVFRLSEMNHDSTAEVVTQLPLAENRYGTSTIRIQSLQVPADGTAIRADQIVYTIESTSVDGGTVLLTVDRPLESTLTSGMQVKLGTISELPHGVSFNGITGELSGHIEYEAAATKTYRFTVIAEWISGNDTIESERCFSLTVVSQYDGALIWDTDSNLGSISPDEPCSRIIAAHIPGSQITPLFSIIDGSLPADLVLLNSGEITGVFNRDSLSENTSGMTRFEDDFSLDANSTKIDRQYSFTVRAANQSNEELGQQTFVLQINGDVAIACNFRVQPFLKPSQRVLLRDFLNNREIFNQDLLFKPTNVNYGVQPALSMLVASGLPLQDPSTLAELVASTHRPTRFSFGNLGTAVAINEFDNVEYEVVYIELLDPREINKVHLPEEITIAYAADPKTKTVSSSYWWRTRLSELGESDPNYIPLWQRSVQPATGVPLGLANIVPICYCKPGTAATILKNINRSGFMFNNIEYIIDRYTVSRLAGHEYNTYIAFDTRNTTI